MRIDITSMFFNSKIEGQTATPAWGTSIGQNKSRDCRIDDFKQEVVDMVVGMTYKSVANLANLDVSKSSSDRDIITCSVFENVYINNRKIEDTQYVLLLVREHSKSHEGRLLVSYAPYIKYNGIANQSCIDLMQQMLGCSSEGCWFVYDISIKNQSELYFSAVVVNATAPMVYSNNTRSKTRSEEWKSLIPADSDSDLVAKTDSSKSLQQIYYGAPGTGKSFEINRLTKNQEVVRTTFHPDSDYSTFVGAYKPVMDKEKRITYQFVKQAFLKAYLGAWKKYINNESTNQEQLLFEVSSGIDTWVINNVDDNKAYYKKITHQDIGWYEQAVKKAWNEGLKTDNYHPFTACNWYSDNNQDEEKNADKCWDAVWNELSAGRPIRSTPGGSQEYVIALEDNSIVITAEGKGDGKGAYKSAIKARFEEKDNNSDTSVQKAIAQKLREYSEDFDEAWEKFKENVEEIKSSDTKTSEPKVISPQFLVIEEINRGNCAQIFGDLFQLLDRGGNGFSEYPIEADTDLQQEIARAFKEEAEYKLARNIEVDGVIKGYKGNFGRRLSEDIQEGRILLLPPNLYIWATMNTSDQSLFPIDSAFKRRWDWKYIRIKDEHKDWKVDIDIKSKDAEGKETTKKLDWWEFVDKINKIIASMTSSADKQLGYFFCKATKKVNDSDSEATIITKDTFVSKVIFYLWNDVFKDYGFEDASLFRYKEVNPETNKEEEKDLTFPDFYDEAGEQVNTERLTDFVEKVLSWQKTKEEQK